MNPLQELSELILGKSRVILISEKDVDLRSQQGENKLFVLKMVEGSLAAGGRGAGFGERRVTKVLLFRCQGADCEKLFETEEELEASAFEIPYYVSRIPLIMSDGTEAMGYGVVDPALVAEYSRKVSR